MLDKSSHALTLERVALFEMRPFVVAMMVSLIWGTGEEVQNSPASMKLGDRWIYRVCQINRKHIH